MHNLAFRVWLYGYNRHSITRWNYSSELVVSLNISNSELITEINRLLGWYMCFLIKECTLFATTKIDFSNKIADCDIPKAAQV